MDRSEYLKLVTVKKECICQYCKKSFMPKKADRTKYCSRECYFQAKSNKSKEKKLIKEIERKSRACKICGKTLPEDIIHGVYCSDNCRRENARRIDVEINIKKKKVEIKCKECGKIFIPVYGDKRRTFCSKECGNKNSRRKRRVKHKERAEKNGVFYEPVDTLKVFERDKWTCQICHKKLNPLNRGTILPDAPELDHIIPWAKGGEHSYSNTQCLCRSCNATKGDKLE